MNMVPIAWLPGHPTARPRWLAFAAVMSMVTEVLKQVKNPSEVAPSWVHCSEHTSEGQGTTCAAVATLVTSMMFV